MTREETQDLLAMVQAVYPNFNPPDKTAAINAWRMALSDLDYKDVERAFAIYMRTDSRGFAPAPGQIVEKIQMLTTPQELNEIEAWSLVNKALRNSTYNSVEEFSKLPPIVQKAVGQPSQLRAWSTDENFSEGVASSNFIRSYRIELERLKELNKMPEKVRTLIENTNQNSYRAKLTVQNVLEVKDMVNKEKTEIKAIEDKEKPLEIPDKAMERLREFGLKD